MSWGDDPRAVPGPGPATISLRFVEVWRREAALACDRHAAARRKPAALVGVMAPASAIVQTGIT